MNFEKINSYPELLTDHIEFGYAAVPILIGQKQDKLVITKRNSLGKSLPFVYSFSKEKLLAQRTTNLPFLQLGMKGTFDEDGIMPVCSVIVNEKIYLYYIGWNIAKSVPFRNSIGLAISENNGISFYKPYKGPIMDRSIHDPCFVASCEVIFDEGIYKMWYLSCDEWNEIDGVLNHKYNIKYATSIDAINWHRDGIIAINYFWENEYAISVPRIIKENGIYKMWYSYRGCGNIKTYRIGYAESFDGIRWERKDKLMKLTLSQNEFDSEMVCYPFIYDYNGERYIMYNGNGYGKAGFGIAKFI